ncbi:MAG: PTS system mannose/fructose/N-acetylgalactosamine-transporter subunit IIB [Gemmatimonadaceae bacterium]
MTLVLYRVDDRLIHGQVVVGWGQPLDVAFIVLVDDEVAASDWEQELYRMGVPPQVEVYFDSVESAARNLPRYQADPRRGMLLTGEIAPMRALVARGGIPAVNVGGIHHRPGRHQKLRYVFLTEEESAALSDIAAQGVTVTAQDVPSARPVALDDIIRGVGQ